MELDKYRSKETPEFPYCLSYVPGRVLQKSPTQNYLQATLKSTHTKKTFAQKCLIYLASQEKSGSTTESILCNIFSSQTPTVNCTSPLHSFIHSFIRAAAEQGVNLPHHTTSAPQKQVVYPNPPGWCVSGVSWKLIFHSPIAEVSYVSTPQTE